MTDTKSHVQSLRQSLFFFLFFYHAPPPRQSQQNKYPSTRPELLWTMCSKAMAKRKSGRKEAGEKVLIYLGAEIRILVESTSGTMERDKEKNIFC